MQVVVSGYETFPAIHAATSALLHAAMGSTLHAWAVSLEETRRREHIYIYIHMLTFQGLMME